MLKFAFTVFLMFGVTPLASAQRVFDTHVHVWNGEQSIRDYQAQLKETGLSVNRFGGILIAHPGKMAETRHKNDELIALAAKYPEMSHHLGPSLRRPGGARRVAPHRRARRDHDQAPSTHTQNFAIADPRVAALCKLAGELGVVVLFDNASIVPGDCQDLFNLAINTPGTKFVFAHMGATNFRFWNTIVFAKTAKDFYKDNIYFDISATVVLVARSPIEAEFIWTIRNVGVDHVLLGSDYLQFTLRQTIDAFEHLDLERSEKDKILYDNARKLLTPEAPQ